MKFEFDPAKDKVNLAKHGVSLGSSTDLKVLAMVEDQRFAFTVRNKAIRAISLRRAHTKEIKCRDGAFSCVFTRRKALSRPSPG